MNREIKFRGKGYIDNKWYYGFLSVNLTVEPSIYFIDTGLSKDATQRVNPKTIGQYTGLKDKNGVEIYEGDEVAYFYEHIDVLRKFKTIEELRNRDKSKSKLDYDIGVIQMVNGHYLLVEKNGDCAPISETLENITSEIDEHDEICYYEVIGNIHEK